MVFIDQHNPIAKVVKHEAGSFRLIGPKTNQPATTNNSGTMAKIRMVAKFGSLISGLAT